MSQPPRLVRRARTEPTSRPARRTTQVRWTSRPAATSSRDSVRAGMVDAGVGLELLEPAGPLQGVDLPRVRGRRREDLLAAGHRGGRHQVGTALGGPAYGLLATPRGDPAVVAREQHLRDVAAAPAGRLGVDGVLQQPVLVRLLHQGLGVAHEAREQAHHRLGDRQRGHLSPVEDVVAQRDLPDLAERGRVVDHALVDALVATAREHQVVVGRQLAGQRLGEGPPARGGEDDGGPVGGHRVQRVAPRLRASSPCRRRRRTACRRRCGAGRWPRSAGRGRARSSRPLSRALPGRLS